MVDLHIEGAKINFAWSTRPMCNNGSSESHLSALHETQFILGWLISEELEIFTVKNYPPTCILRTS